MITRDPAGSDPDPRFQRFDRVDPRRTVATFLPELQQLRGLLKDAVERLVGFPCKRRRWDELHPGYPFIDWPRVCIARTETTLKTRDSLRGSHCFRGLRSLQVVTGGKHGIERRVDQLQAIL